MAGWKTRPPLKINLRFLTLSLPLSAAIIVFHTGSNPAKLIF
jgi:hypothetical protein